MWKLDNILFTLQLFLSSTEITEESSETIHQAGRFYQITKPLALSKTLSSLVFRPFSLCNPESFYSKFSRLTWYKTRCFKLLPSSYLSNILYHKIQINLNFPANKKAITVSRWQSFIQWNICFPHHMLKITN